MTHARRQLKTAPCMGNIFGDPRIPGLVLDLQSARPCECGVCLAIQSVLQSEAKNRIVEHFQEKKLKAMWEGGAAKS